MATTLRLPDDLAAQVAARAAREGASKNAILVNLVREHVNDDIAENAHDAAVGEAIAHLQTRWSDVLDRLGRA